MQGTRRRPYYLRDKKITLLPRFTLRWDAGEDSENSYRLVQRHKTGADELTLQTIWHAAKGTRSKSVVRVFLSLHPDDARGVVQSIETHGGSAAVIPSLLAPLPQSADVRLSRSRSPTPRSASPPRDYGEICSRLSPKATRTARALGPPTASASPSHRFRE
jgi:hypothetical protein